MLRAFIENFMGQFGTTLFNLYAEYSLWINILVVLYGAWIVLSWVNLKNIRSRLIQELAGQLRSQGVTGSSNLSASAEGAKGSGSRMSQRRLDIPWEGVVREARFPFIAHQGALWPKRLSLETVRALLPEEELLEDALQTLAPAGKVKRGA
jgi:hypothetical protein